MDLKFSTLLTRALSEWPSEVDLTSLKKSSPGATRYSIEGLYDMGEKIE